MKYLKYLNEFLQNPRNVQWELNRMLKELENLLQNFGMKMSQRTNNQNLRVSLPQNRSFDISCSISITSDSESNPEKILNQVKKQLDNFFDKWTEIFEKTNTSLIKQYTTFYGFGIDLYLKDIKFTKWRYTKGKGKKLFHFSDAVNRLFIQKNGLAPTDNSRSNAIFGMEVATNYPAVYAMPSFDLSNIYYVEVFMKLFKTSEHKVGQFTSVSLLNSGTFEVRECTLVPDKSYSFDSSDPLKKVDTQWTITIDETISNQFKLKERPRFFDLKSEFVTIDESLFNKSSLEIDDKRKEKHEREKKDETLNSIIKQENEKNGISENRWIILNLSYTIDLWEIDLDKINHEWWIDPAGSVGISKKEDPWWNWLISYDGTIPTDAIKLIKTINRNIY
jgi:hypothetical protein